MSAPVGPAPSSSSASRRAYMSLRNFIVTHFAGGSKIAHARNDGSAAAVPYEMLLRFTFGTSDASGLVRLPRADVRKRAPSPFNEAFEDVPPETKTGRLALSIFGTAGVILMIGVIIGAGICVNIQRLQSADPPAQTSRPAAAAKPADKPGSEPTSPSKDVIPRSGLDVDVPGLSKILPAAPNQAAPQTAPGGNISREPEKAPDKAPPPNAQQQRPKQAN